MRQSGLLCVFVSLSVRQSGIFSGFFFILSVMQSGILYVFGSLSVRQNENLYVFVSLSGVFVFFC